MARSASKALTRECAQELIWSMEDSGDPNPDVWEHISDYCDCGPICDPQQDYAEFILDGDELYDAIMDIRAKGK